jgi:hypothetical protein
MKWTDFLNWEPFQNCLLSKLSTYDNFIGVLIKQFSDMPGLALIFNNLININSRYKKQVESKLLTFPMVFESQA